MTDKPATPASTPPPTTPVSKEKEVDYSNAKFLDEQINLMEQELHSFELQCQSQISFRRGTLNALQAMKEKKPVISKTAGPMTDAPPAGSAPPPPKP
jgi:hypothetical protein